MEPIVRPYKNGDAEKIHSFFQSLTSIYKRDAEFWVWINRLLTSDMYVQVAEVDGEIIGHYAALPVYLNIDGQEVKAAQMLHIVIHPEYRNLALSYPMMKQLYKRLREDGYALTYGFPNVNIRQIALRIEKVTRVDLFNSYQLKSLDFQISQVLKYSIEETDLLSCNDLFNLNDFFEKHHSHSRVEIKKNAKYWMCRYNIHPQKLYKFITIKGKSDNIVGYFVCKSYISDNIKYWHIIDFIVENTINIKDAINSMISHYCSDVDIFSVWKGDEPFETAIKDIGFVADGFDTFLGIKILDEEYLTADKVEILKDFKNWSLVMGDSDAF